MNAELQTESLSEYLDKMRAKADEYRENERLVGGWVIFFGSLAECWMVDLEEASKYRPGATAVDPEGNVFIACGGGYYHGAESWVPYQ